jgi:pimeloyl-ACP methyl ester carboxylesterase
MDGRMWAPQEPALGAGRKVLVPDLLGFGRTPVPEGACSLERQADALALFATAHGARRLVVCGLSMGGYIALAFAERFPYRLAGLILADTRAGADTEAVRQGRSLSAKRVREEGVASVAEGLLAKLFHPRLQPRNGALMNEVRALMLSQRPEAVAGALEAMRDRPSRASVLKKLQCPVLVIVGEGDMMTPPEEARAMTALNSGARVLVIPEAGHLSNLEAPAAFNEGVASFLSML